MNGLFARIITRVLPRDMPTPVGRWRNEHYTVIAPLGHQGTEVKPVGRWSIETCDKKINARIDRSNEDHCGPCGRNDVNR
jgi:hypothetical protein